MWKNIHVQTFFKLCALVHAHSKEEKECLQVIVEVV